MASKFTDGPNDSLRFSDVAGEQLRRLAPLRGYENMQLVSLEEATDPLIPHVPEIKHMVDNALENSARTSDILPIDERASIMLYSMEWSPRKNSFYRILNDTLRSTNRDELLPSWFLFLKLFLTALTRLSSTPGRVAYRGVKMDLRKDYPEGSKIIWWGISSCTSRLDVLKNEQFFGKSGTRTLFTIECDTGKAIRDLAMFPEEEEILLPPGREFKVVSCLDAGNNLYMIHLKEIVPKFPHIAPVVPPNLPNPSAAVMKNDAQTKSTPQQAQAKIPVPEAKPAVELWYASNKLTDVDMQRVMNEALIEKKCTSLNLRDNKITHEGAAIIAKAIQNNKVRSSFRLEVLKNIGSSLKNSNSARLHFYTCFNKIVI